VRDEAGASQTASTSLSLSNLVAVRRQVLNVLATLAPAIHLGNASTTTSSRITKTAFELIASYLADPVDAVSPSGCAQLAGIPLAGQPKPPVLVDLALDLFTRLCLPDYNRQAFAKAVPSSWIWQLFESLVRRLPVSDTDFHLVIRESWLLYLERVVMSLYSLAFLAPPALKERAKTQHNLGFAKIMFRMIQRLLSQPVQAGGSPFIVCVRRAIETMKMVDDGQDSFDSPKSVVPPMTFGMGWDEVGDHCVEKGMGLLAGYRGVTWDLLMMRDFDSDHVLFSELESLSRVG
jgi:SWI/SNF chromatin-remodeling complex subunit SWI1